MEPPADDPMTDDEFRAFVRQLHRYCSEDLDQWSNWRLPTRYGEVYVHIGREPPPGWLPEQFDELSAWLTT